MDTPPSTSTFDLSNHSCLWLVLRRPSLCLPPPPAQVDLDIHTYTYIARTALLSFMTRLASVIWEVAFVIQGNASDELPEQVRAGQTVTLTF